MKEEITKFFNDCKNSIDELNEQCGTLEDIINILQKAQKNSNTIYTIGNGGSGSTASHFVSDLLKTSINLRIHHHRFENQSYEENALSARTRDEQMLQGQSRPRFLTLLLKFFYSQNHMI